MKLLLLTTFLATICYVNAGKTQRMLAAMLGMNPGMMAGLNRGIANGVMNPGILAGGLNPAMLAGGGAGFIGQPQFAQFVPGVPAFAAPAPIANVYAVPAVNGFPFMGGPQVARMNPPQQPQMGVPGGAMQQQLPPQPDPFRRLRRQISKKDNTFKTTVDTQIPAPTETTTTTPCEEQIRHEDY
ncbi:hypothetical protein PBY51_020364 [Eleginops maclovinus]|uniref:Secretory calcium-binding phosphoprotein 9 n=1 Tax=Eleginops maclovinus TaxID=56733 RepID=A0AAN8AT53_ELEMC|nr:hypothetical protein PBY51_020364 [Eleginops maclovinus]